MKRIKKLAAVLAAVAVLFTALPVYASEDVISDAVKSALGSEESQTEEVSVSSSDEVVCLGADLTSDERASVLANLGLTEETIAGITVINVTNTEEHQYLDSYLSQDLIGSRALSSCIVKQGTSGQGIKVTTKNITYCTEKMYQNALATAGMKDADVVVAGPFDISGTAALVGTLKAYSEMSGELIQPEAIETATNEIITTGAVAENIGDSDKAAALIAAVKEIVLEGNLATDEDIDNAIDQVAAQLGVEVTDSDRETIRNYIIQFKSLDVSVEQIKEQAPEIYQDLQDSGIDLSQFGISEEDLGGILGFFKSLWDAIVKLFS